MVRGIIFDIKKYALHDGPGIRTTIFLKGCPLDCWWCHNPESKNDQIETIQQKINSVTSTKIIGKYIDDDEVFQEIMKDELFYDESGGGVTFSGGEPLMQSEFLLSILKKCKRAGIHTAIDTSGYCTNHDLKKIMKYTDLFLFDLKLIDNELHEKYMNTNNDIILNNLEYLFSEDRNIQIRVPLIPGITDTKENMNDIRGYLEQFKNLFLLNFIPYNQFGEDKVLKFNYPNKFGKLRLYKKTEIDEIAENFKRYGFQVEIGG